MRLRLLRAVRGGVGLPTAPPLVTVRQPRLMRLLRPGGCLSLLDLHRGHSRGMTLTFGARATTRAEPASPPGSLFFVLVRLVRLA